MKLLFMHIGWLPKSPCFNVLLDCGVSLSDMCVREGEPIYDSVINTQFGVSLSTGNTVSKPK